MNGDNEFKLVVACEKIADELKRIRVLLENNF